MNHQMVSIQIDGKSILAPQGARVLWVALENGIYIPNLCAIREEKTPEASCRLCFVELKGKVDPILACTEEVFEGMDVRTDTPGVMRLRRSAAELLIASHQTDCPNCPKNRRCELQRIAHHLKLKLRPNRLRSLLHDFPVDESHPALSFDPNKCLLCGRCVWVCKKKAKCGIFQFSRRGFGTRLSTFSDSPLAETSCTGCLECVRVCPVGALAAKTGLFKLSQS